MERERLVKNLWTGTRGSGEVETYAPASDFHPETDFWEEFLEEVEREFGIDPDMTEEGLRYGLSLPEEEFWGKEIPTLALLIGEKRNLTNGQVKKELESFLTHTKWVREQNARQQEAARAM